MGVHQKENPFTAPQTRLKRFIQPQCKEKDVDIIISECIIPNGACTPDRCHYYFGMSV